MSKSRTREYFESLSNTPVRFSPYATLRTGLVSSQTLLSLEEYTLICSPYQVSMKKVTLLLILSPEETRFFQRFRYGQCGLNLTFEKPGANHTTVFDVRGKIDRIGPIKNRQNVCMIDITFINCPDELIEIIGDYIMSYNALRGYYANFQGGAIYVDENMARMLRYNNYMECFIARKKVRAELLSISVNQIVFQIPSDAPDIIEGNRISAKLYFQLYQFVVTGTIEAIEGYKGSLLRAHVAIDFAPELIEIMDDYFYRLSHSQANPPPMTNQDSADLIPI